MLIVKTGRHQCCKLPRALADGIVFNTFNPHGNSHLRLSFDHATL